MKDSTIYTLLSIGIFVLFLFAIVAHNLPYGQGTTEGYVYAIDDTLFATDIWYKSSLDSSESDRYTVTDPILVSLLRDAPKKYPIQLQYNRYLWRFYGAHDVVINYNRMDYFSDKE